MAVTEQNTVFTYVGNGVTTVFPYGCRILDDDDLVVTVDDAVQTRGVVYTVSGANNPSGGNVTFLVAPVNAAAVKLFRDTSVERSTDYQTGGDFLAATVNPDFDRPLMAIQDFISGSKEIANALRVPAGEAVTVLPVLADRAGLLLGFDAYGNPVALAPADGSALALAMQLITGFGAIIRASGFQTAAVGFAGSATFYAKKTITTHADYGFLDDSTIDYAGGAPIYGHATFDDNVTFTGSVDSDHHHSFQSYPHFGSAATIARLSGFWMQPDITAGTVTELSQFRANDPTGSGATITNLFGFYCAPLTKGVGNYAFFAEGSAWSHMGYKLTLGSIANAAKIEYEGVSGNLEISPRATYKIHMRGPVLFGTSATSEATAAKIEYNGVSGDLEITPRSTFSLMVKAAKLYLGASGGFEALIENTAAGPLEITPRATFGAKVKSSLEATGPVVLPSYTVGTLPSAATYARGMIYVSNESGGATTAFSDGTNWRRHSDRAIVS